MKTPSDTEAKRLEILFGGTTIEVTRIDRTGEQPTIVTEELTVRLIPVSSMQKMASVFGQDLVAEASVYAGRTPEYIDSLIPESALLVIQTGRKLNEKSMAAFLDVQRGTARAMGIDLDAIVKDAAQQAAAGVLNSPKSSNS